MEDKIKCPFCGGEVHIVVCDDDANIHREKGYEEDPWNGLGYVLIHKQEDVPNNTYCPIATYADEDFIGGLIYDTREEAVKIWENNEIARLTEENERLRKQLSDGKCIYLSDSETAEGCVQSPCPNYKTVEDILKENAELKARLEKAVILPCKCEDTLYCVHWNKYNPKGGIITEEFVHKITLNDRNNTYTIHTICNGIWTESKFVAIDFGDILFTDPEKAEARLAELKGGEQE